MIQVFKHFRLGLNACILIPMRALSIAAAVAWTASAWGAEPARVYIQVKDDAGLTWVKEHPQPEADMLALETTLIPDIEKWGSPGTHLSREARDHLHRILTQASREIPLRFHYFSRSAGQFDDDQLSEVFTALLRGPGDFKELIMSRIRFFGDKAGEEAAPGAHASQDLVARDDSGRPRLDMTMSSNETGCSMETLFDGTGGEPCSDSQHSAVAAGDDSRAIGPAEPENKSRTEEDTQTVSAYARVIAPAEPK